LFCQHQQIPETSSTITQHSRDRSPSILSESSENSPLPYPPYPNLQFIATSTITSEDSLVPAPMETSNVNDELVKQHMKIAEDAIAGMFLIYLFTHTD
jgi:hypothetical protein